MKIRMLDLKAQYDSIRKEIDSAITRVIAESAFVGGTHVARFEEAFARYQDAEFCIGVGNGTDALEIAIESLGLPKGSEIIVPANTFVASGEAVTRTGHRVVFCDCDPVYYTMSPAKLEEKITEKTSALIAVHLYGHPCDMDAILGIARRYGLKVIEDCAQAHGAEYRGQRVGTIGDIGTFSFYPGKNLGAYGDGGAILTDDPDLARRCRMIANHGRVEKYNHEFEGRNSRLDGLQAAILLVKLGHLERWTERRRELAEYYRGALADLPGLVLPAEADWARHVYHQFVIRTSDRDLLKDRLNERGIQTGIHYPIALPRLRAYAYLGQAEEDFTAIRFADEILSLPIGEHLETEEVHNVCDVVREFLWTGRRSV